MEQIEYTRTVVPSSMRSPYWKYFGFPSDSGNNILTRQKIVCTICNTAIAYNKNTSNLRTHLMSKHVEIFQKLVTPSNNTFAPEQNLITIHDAEKPACIDKQSFNRKDPFSVNVIKRRRSDHHYNRHASNEAVQPKINLVDNLLPMSEYSNNISPESSSHRRNDSTGVLVNKVDLKLQSTEYIAFIPTNDSELIEVTETSNEILPSSIIVDDPKNGEAFTYVDVPEEHNQQLHSMDIMLADMIQSDLLSLDILLEPGFCKYNQQLTGLKMDDDTIKRVIKLIETRYTNTKAMITSHVVRYSQSQPYSLSIEIYKDNDGQDILNIYFNYLNDNQMDLISILYKSSTLCAKATDISDLLMEINLKNCSGVVVSCLDIMFEFVLEFTKYYELPLIECLESLLSRCLQKSFEINELCADYKKLFKTALENTNRLHMKKSILRSRCNWSKFNFLDYMLKTLELNDLQQWDEIKRSFEYIKPLKMALDIINDEQLPLCTLTRPLIIKLFEEHFSSNNQDSIRISKIKKILEKELHERTMDQHFLNEATFFDARFHRDFALHEPQFDVANVKNRVLKRFNHILQVTYINKPSDIKIEQNSSDLQMNSRKCSSLKSFFKRDVILTNSGDNTDLKTNLDIEFEQYQIQACLDLDQSPALWWQQQSDNYKQLSKIAKYYLTIPCCCLPRLYQMNMEQRYLKLDRRKNLSQLCNTESKLWYLFYNEDVAESI